MKDSQWHRLAVYAIFHFRFDAISIESPPKRRIDLCAHTHILFL